MIPQNITRDHVVQALQEIDHDDDSVVAAIGRLRRRLHAGKKYPPKYVISIAHKHAYGAELASDEFSPNDASTFLKKLGFDIVKRPKPGLKVGPRSRHRERARRVRATRARRERAQDHRRDVRRCDRASERCW